jgi:hypothetical protein
LRFIRGGEEADSKLLAEVGEIKKPIHIQLPYRTFFKLDKFVKENRLDSYSKAIEKLIDIGLLLDEHKEEIQDHELLKEFEIQYKEGGLVDYFQKLSPSDFKIINSIMKTEDLCRQKTMNSFIEQKNKENKRV